MALSDRAALESSNSIAEIARVVVVDRCVTLSSANSGLTLSGTESVLRCAQPYGDFITRGALAIHAGWGGVQTEPQPASSATVVNPGEVGWLYNTLGDGTYLYPGPVTMVRPNEAVKVGVRSFTKAVKAVPIDGGNLVLDTGPHPFFPGDDVFATDGPLINELIPEWRRVVDVTPTTVTLDRPINRRYASPALCGGQVPRRMTFKNIRFEGQMGPVFIAQSVDLRFEDCTFAMNTNSGNNAGWLTIVGSARLTFDRCKIESGMSISSSHDVTFRDCTIRRLIAEQGATDVLLERCSVKWIDSRIRCTHWTLRDSTFDEWLPVYDYWTVDNCRTFGPTAIRGYRAYIRNLQCPTLPYFEAGYQGHPPRAAEETVVENLRVGL